MRVKINDLPAGKEYTVQIRANDGQSVSDWSRTYKLNTLDDPTQPREPQNVTWEVKGQGFRTNWDAVTLRENGNELKNLSHYEIRIRDANGNSVSFDTAGNQTTNTHFHFSFEENRSAFGTPKHDLWLKIRAVTKTNKAGNWSNEVRAMNPAPAQPTGLSKEVSENTVQMKWNKNTDTDLAGYKLYVNGVEAWDGSANAKSLVLDYGTTYTISLVAYDVFGTESSAASTQVTTEGRSDIVDRTPPAVPTGLTATLSISNTATLDTTARVSWNPVADEDMDLYAVRYKRPTDSAQNWQQVVVTKDTTSVVITGLFRYTNYEFQVSAYDVDANPSEWSPVYVAQAPSNVAPSQPAAPGVAANNSHVQVTHSGIKNGGGAMDADVVQYEVYAATSPNFSTSGTLRTTMPAGPAISVVFPVPAEAVGTAPVSAQTWYAKVIAVDSGGLRSAVSPESSVSVPLISTANIADAAITNAKITNLQANKITAGDGLIANIVVGNASTPGSIRSYNYAATTAGWIIDSTGFAEINNVVVRGVLSTGLPAGPMVTTNTTSDPMIIFIDKVPQSQPPVIINQSPYIKGRANLITAKPDDSGIGTGYWTGPFTPTVFDSSVLNIYSGKIASSDSSAEIQIISGRSSQSQVSRVALISNVVRIADTAYTNGGGIFPRASLVVLNDKDTQVGTDMQPAIRIGRDNSGIRMRLYHDGISMVDQDDSRAPLSIMSSDLRLQTAAAGGGLMKINGDRLASRTAGDADRDKITIHTTHTEFNILDGNLTVAGGSSINGRIFATAGDVALVFQSGEIRVTSTNYVGLNPTDINHRVIRAKEIGQPSSEKSRKTNIVEVDGTEAVESIKALPVSDFGFKGETPDVPKARGIMVEDAREAAPVAVIENEEAGATIGIMGYTFTLGAAVREIIFKVESLQEEVALLREQSAKKS